MSDLRIELTPEAKRTLKTLDRAWRRGPLYDSIDQFFAREAPKVASIAIRNFLSGQELKRRTGSLARSVVGQSVRVNGVPALTVGIFQGPALKYAAVQEFGTVGKGGLFPTIRPKKAKTLAIPQKPVLTAAGVGRFPSPRDYPGKLSFRLIGKGNVVGALVDADEATSDDPAEALWLLVRKVDIRPKRYLQKAMEKALPGIGARLSTHIVSQLSPGRQAG